MRLLHLLAFGPRYDTLSCSSGAKMLQGAPMSDTPRPPPLPQHGLIWIVVAALVLVLVRAVWRGLF